MTKKPSRRNSGPGRQMLRDDVRRRSLGRIDAFRDQRTRPFLSEWVLLPGADKNIHEDHRVDVAWLLRELSAAKAGAKKASEGFWLAADKGGEQRAPSKVATV